MSNANACESVNDNDSAEDKMWERQNARARRRAFKSAVNQLFSEGCGKEVCEETKAKLIAMIKAM